MCPLAHNQKAAVKMLVTTFMWIGTLKFTDYEVENAEPLVTASPLTSRLREKLGAQKLARLIGITQITLALERRDDPLGMKGVRVKHRNMSVLARIFR